MRVYATTQEYADWLDPDAAPGAPIPAKAAVAVRAASARVDELLIASRYATDVDGYPTEQAHIDALREATCVQAERAKALGDTGSGVGLYSDASAGSLGLKRAASAVPPGGVTPPQPETYAVLQRAGLVPAGPDTRVRDC